VGFTLIIPRPRLTIEPLIGRRCSRSARIRPSIRSGSFSFHASLTSRVERRRSAPLTRHTLVVRIARKIAKSLFSAPANFLPRHPFSRAWGKCTEPFDWLIFLREIPPGTTFLYGVPVTSIKSPSKVKSFLCLPTNRCYGKRCVITYLVEERADKKCKKVYRRRSGAVGFIHKPARERVDSPRLGLVSDRGSSAPRVVLAERREAGFSARACRELNLGFEERSKLIFTFPLCCG